MSLTSYRAAPPRVNLMVGLKCAARSLCLRDFLQNPWGCSTPRQLCLAETCSQWPMTMDKALICMKGFDEGVLLCIALIDLAATYSPAP